MGLSLLTVIPAKAGIHAALTEHESGSVRRSAYTSRSRAGEGARG